MNKRTGSFIVGIGIASMAAGIFQASRTGEWMDGLIGVFIGATLIGTVLIEQGKKANKDQ